MVKTNVFGVDAGRLILGLFYIIVFEHVAIVFCRAISGGVMALADSDLVPATPASSLIELV